MKLVHHILERTAARYPDKTAIVIHGKRYSYRQLNYKADIIAQNLIELGLEPECRVVIYLTDSIETVIAMFGILKAGGVFVILNHDLRHKKLNYILKDTDAEWLIYSADKHFTVECAIGNVETLKGLILSPRNEVATNTVPITVPKNTNFYNWVDLISCDRKKEIKPIEAQDDQIAALIYTSGTSGYPKGVISAHYNIIEATKSINQYLQNSLDDIILNVLPMSFDYGLYQVFLAFSAGATLIIENGFTYPYKVLDILISESVTGFPIVPVIAGILAKLKREVISECHQLRYITNTGDVLPENLIKRLLVLFPQAKIFLMYGLTECKRATYLPPEQIQYRPDSVGIPIPNCQAKIVDYNGNEVGANEVGELVIQGKNVMQGYWKQKSDTDAVFKFGSDRKDAMLFTRDLFRKDEDGYLYFVCRIDHLLKIKGERISPKEIEDFINGIDGVIQSAVVGIEDEKFGKSVIAYVSIDKESEITPEFIKQRCADGLESVLVPDIVEICDILPVSENMKIHKNKLKALGFYP